MSAEGRSLVWVALALASVVKLYLALTTAGTLDAAAFADHLSKIEQYGGLGAYHVRGAFDNPFNSPPFIVHALRALGWLSDTTRLPFAFWLRFPCVVADAASLLLTWQLLARLQPRRDLTRPLLLVALSPVAVILSGFHGNTDPIMICFVLLAVWLAERGGRGLSAGAAFGLALSIKVAPLLYAPAFLCYLPDWRRRFRFCAAVALVWLACATPYVWQEPLTIARAVFGYGSLYGNWGWTYWLARWQAATLTFAHAPHDVTGPHAFYAAAGKWLLLVTAGAFALRLNRRARRVPLFLQCGLVTALFLALTPGFGPQYLAWLVPWLGALALWPALAFQLLGGVYLFVSYTCYIYRAAPPGYCTNASEPLTMNLCWAAVIIVIACYARTLRRNADPEA
jgi:hypothetical protein